MIPDNATDTSLFCLPIRANGAYAFKLALYLISRGLQGVDARIVNTLHDEKVIEVRDAIEDQESLGLDPAQFDPDCRPERTAHEQLKSSGNGGKRPPGYRDT